MGKANFLLLVATISSTLFIMPFPCSLQNCAQFSKHPKKCLPPLQWLISIIHPPFTGTGSPHICPSYRDILLAKCGGKLFRQVPRNALLPHLNSYALDSMCGGILSKGTVFCSDYVRVVKSLTKRRGSSLCIIFADVVCAFASVLRDLVVHNQISDVAVAVFFSRFGCNQSVCAEFVSLVHGLSAMDFAQVPVPLQNIVAALAGKSCFTMRGSIKFVDHTNGTGAGNPLADVLFNFLIARVLRYIDLRLSGHGLRFVDSHAQAKEFLWHRPQFICSAFQYILL